MNARKLGLLTVAMAPAMALAQEGAHAMAAGEAPKVAAYWGAAIAIGLASSVVAFSQSRAAAAALEGIGRNPSAAGSYTVPLILSLALMEALGLLAFLVANTLLTK